MAHFLVTGGAGFIGAHLANSLSQEHDVSILDNLTRRSRIPLNDEVNIVRGDVCDGVLVDRLVKSADLVYHLAAVSQVITSINDPDTTYRSNVFGTKVVVEACLKHKKMIIFASSREVYGTPKILPADTNAPLQPENPYAASKVCGEMLIKAYGLSYGLRYNIVRLSNVYGSGDSGRVVPIFLDCCLNNKTLTIYGHKKIIDFVYISDVIDAFLCVKGHEGTILNIGSGKGTDLLQLGETIIKLTGTSSNYELLDARDGEVDRFCADISLTKKTLGWAPKVSLEEGLRKIIRQVIAE